MKMHHRCRSTACIHPGLLLLVLWLSGCASLPDPAHAAEATSVNPPAETLLATALQPLAAAHPGESGYFLLSDGMDALAARLAMIDHAEAAIDLQYYIWHHDLVGKALLARLYAAAERGVRVRLLLDDLDTAGKDRLLTVLDAHPNISVRLFNPFTHRNSRWLDFISSPWRLNHRMHNKAIVVDGAVAVMGGRNIGDEYFDAAAEVGFNDMDVLGVGPVVDDIGHAFNLYWNSQLSYAIDQLSGELPVDRDAVANLGEQLAATYKEAQQSTYAEALIRGVKERYPSPGTMNFHWGRWRLVYDQPDKVDAKKITAKTHLAPGLKRAMDAVQEDLVIVSPYFVPGTDFTEYLTDKVEQGVRIRVLTNSLSANDVPLVHAGYRRYRETLIEGGVELYEFKALAAMQEQHKGEEKKKGSYWGGSSRASLHGKYLGFDRRYMFVGSFNLDARSVALNTELGVYFEDRPYAELLDRRFDQNVPELAYRVLLDEDGDLYWQTLEGGEMVQHYQEPETSAWQRLVNRVQSWFVPESQL